MKKVSFTLAAAVSVGALYPSLCLADDATSPTPSADADDPRSADTDEVASPPPVAQPTPQRPAPVQPVPAHTAPQPVATTTTRSAPVVAPARDSYAESTTSHRPNRALLSTGIGMFVVSYGASVVAAAVSSTDADKNLFVPVAGPWMDLSDRDGSGQSLSKALVVTSGVVQGAGVLLALSSLIIPETTSTKSRRVTAEASDAEVRVTPLSFHAGAGVGAIGRF